ncbi:hypothetical protein PAXRUDRAFT_827782 [Paxillus rubicundulus Ve08.2h10]|uniref:DUF6533 domain-containing protein n=1 Tax=Paxillus rubicundulus Ve08.2h10 TaxID=930991 RepID=A0A0D0E297_9AGAM|nr:hypothetical protein PAXRUDRAFT_827782 [Paxillus rubicundulus Ve08.2h10]
MTTDSVTFFQSHTECVRDVRTHCLASFVLHVWDTTLTFGDEVEHIWPVPWKSPTKLMYLFLRHISLIIHGVYAFSISHLTSGYASASACSLSVILGVVTIQVLHTCVEYLLAKRAYALFNKSRYVAILLGLLIAAEVVNMCISISDVTSGVSFETVCVIFPAPKKTTTFGIIVPITQTILVGSIVFKSVLARCSGWGRTPLVSLLIREGLVTYLLMTILFGFAVIWCLREDERAVSLVFWSMSIMSTCGCRLITNTEKLGRNQGRHTSLLLTTQIEVFESPIS